MYKRYKAWWPTGLRKKQSHWGVRFIYASLLIWRGNALHEPFLIMALLAYKLSHTSITKYNQKEKLSIQLQTKEYIFIDSFLIYIELKVVFIISDPIRPNT